MIILVGSYFDLIAGTLTGGIIAISLAMGLKASEILRLYETQGPAIFGQDHCAATNFALRKVRFLRQIYRRKSSSEALKAALTNVLGARRIGDAKTRLLIPAWSPVAHTVYIYKTAHHERLRTDYKAPAVDAALATSAAPTYFRQHLSYGDVGLVDGGIWANNPIALAVTEAIGVLGWSAASLSILSLGCLEEVYSVPNGGGIGTLGTKAISLFMDGQSHGAIGMAKILTGDVYKRKAIYRIDHHIPYRKYRIDSAAGGQQRVKLIEHFDTFLRDIVNLNDTRITTLEQRVDAMSNFLRTSDYGASIRSFSAQGSWAHKTIIRPQPAKGFDADLVMYVRPHHAWSAKEYIEDLYRVFRNHGTYRDKVSRNTRCVMIDYAGDFSLDVVPVVVRESLLLASTFEVCNRLTDHYEPTAPQAYTAWLAEKK